MTDDMERGPIPSAETSPSVQSAEASRAVGFGNPDRHARYQPTDRSRRLDFDQFGCLWHRNPLTVLLKRRKTEFNGLPDQRTHLILSLAEGHLCRQQDLTSSCLTTLDPLAGTWSRPAICDERSHSPAADLDRLFIPDTLIPQFAVQRHDAIFQ